MVLRVVHNGPNLDEYWWVCSTQRTTKCTYKVRDWSRQHRPVAHATTTSHTRPPLHVSRPTPQPATSATPRPRFASLDRVHLRAAPTRRGRIVGGPRHYAGGFEYLVDFGGDELWLAESQLDLVSLANEPRWEPADAFLRDILLAKLKSQLTDSLYSYGSSRTKFVPYQFKPVLKFLRNPDQRILIADEVGLGKTIEAAIIYLELKARLNISRVLVLCPSRLKGKWQDEMRNRFEEEFTDLDSTGIQKILEDFARYGREIPFRAIASFEMLRSRFYIDQFLTNRIPIDLLIVDEAHYMRNADTLTYQLGHALADSADAAVFLTATPLHLHTDDLYNLMHILSPGDYNDPLLFEEQLRPNTYINAAGRYLAAGRTPQALTELRQVENTFLRDRYKRNPFYIDVVSRLSAGVQGPRQRIALQRDLLELNTFSIIFTRTRKREVEDAAVRAPYSLEVTLSPAERQFYDGVLAQVRQDLRTARGGAPSFSIIMKERQAASCLAAAREAYEEAARTHARASLQVERSAFDVFDYDDPSAPAVPTTSDLLQLSRRINDTDAKFDLFADTLNKALAEDPTSKALVFSFFRRTLAYLHRRLTALGYNVGMIHGEVPVPERRRIIERFATNRTTRILLSSEVGAEGLDFQFCDILVNYDLPWNPMQVEQRIGRLDRFGQLHPRIRIYNFYIADTIETRIFRRLYDRLGIFKHSIGDLEDILGETIQKLSQTVFQANLTPEEQIRRADQEADRIVNLQFEVDALEKEKDQLLGQEALLDQEVQDTIGSGRVVSPAEIRALISTFLDEACSGATLDQVGHEPVYTLRVNTQLAEHIRRYTTAHRDTFAGEPFWRGLADYTEVSFTFVSELARQRPNLEFVTMRHPLAATAIDYWRSKALSGIPSTRVAVAGPSDEAGEGYFFIYLLDVSGATANRILQAVVALDDSRFAHATAATLLKQLQDPSLAQPTLTYDSTDFAAAEQRAASYIATRRDELELEARHRNSALIAVRRASIIASFDAKIARTQRLHDNAFEERIVRMYAGQIRNLSSRKDVKLSELDKGTNLTVSSALVAAGRIFVSPEPPVVTQPAHTRN
jgi:SNF2 family DNA or RNA helicase